MAAPRRTLASLAPASLASISNHRSPVASLTPAGDSGEAMPERRKPNRKALNVRLDPEVISRLKRVAADAAGLPCYATVTGIVTAGINSECERIEAILKSAYSGVPVDPPTPPRRVATGHRRLDSLDNHCVDRT